MSETDLEPKRTLKLEDLIGSKVWIKPRGLPEATGYITAVPKAVHLESIDSSITVSTFEIALACGDVVETSGFNITHIQHAEYNRVSTRRRPRSARITQAKVFPQLRRRYNLHMDIADIVAGIDAEIDRLSRAKALLMGQAPPPKRGQVKRTMSPEGRARVAAAQRARWAKARKK